MQIISDIYEITSMIEEVAADTAEFIARVKARLDRVRECGARINRVAFEDFANPVLDAAQDLTKALRRAADELEDDLPRENPAREHRTYDATSIYGGRM